jgi:SAM-dependent methyltransferase
MRQIITAPHFKKYVGRQSKVLDLGGFDGSVSSALTAQGSQVTVLDLDDKGLITAHGKGLDAVCASAAAIPFDSGTFDVLLSFDMLPSVPEELEEVIIPEIRRVLKKDGHLLLSTVDRNFKLPFVDQNRVNKSWKSREGVSYERLKDLLKLGNLELLEHRAYFSWLTRVLYTILYYWNLPRRGTILKRRLWRGIVKLEQWWCPAPMAHFIIARPSASNS